MNKNSISNHFAEFTSKKGKSQVDHIHEDIMEKEYGDRVFTKSSKPQDTDNNKITNSHIENKNIHVDLDEIDRLSNKVLTPTTKLKNNFIGQPVIDALMQYAVDDPTDKEQVVKQRKKFNWEIFGNSRHPIGTSLNDGTRRSITLPKYIMDAIKFILKTIKLGENNSVTRSIVEDLELTYKDKPIDLSKKLTRNEYLTYSKNVHPNLAWLIISLLLGTVKVDGELSNQIINEISKPYDNKKHHQAKEMEYLLRNQILTPSTASQTTNLGTLISSKTFLNCYNLSLLNTTTRVFSNYDKKELKHALDTSVSGLDNGLVNIKLQQLSSLKLVLANRLHYLFFNE